jgi:hypothetical protein
MEPEGSLLHSRVPATFQTLPIPFFILGIKQGHGIITCNTEDLLVIDLVCVFVEVSLTALYFSVTYCPTFTACTALMQVPYVSECPREGLGNTRQLCERGTSCEGGAIICHVECITASFLTFFPVWGEHSVTHGRPCTGEGLYQVCGHRSLLHRSTVGLAQEWTPPR